MGWIHIYASSPQEVWSITKSKCKILIFEMITWGWNDSSLNPVRSWLTCPPCLWANLPTDTIGILTMSLLYSPQDLMRSNLTDTILWERFTHLHSCLWTSFTFRLHQDHNNVTPTGPCISWTRSNIVDTAFKYLIWPGLPQISLVLCLMLTPQRIQR